MPQKPNYIIFHSASTTVGYCTCQKRCLTMIERWKKSEKIAPVFINHGSAIFPTLLRRSKITTGRPQIVTEDDGRDADGPINLRIHGPTVGCMKNRNWLTRSFFMMLVDDFVSTGYELLTFDFIQHFNDAHCLDRNRFGRRHGGLIIGGVTPNHHFLGVSSSNASFSSKNCSWGWIFDHTAEFWKHLKRVAPPVFT